MTDKRQAIIDAVQAIQEARAVYGKKPEQLPQGEFHIKVDPRLNEPKHNTTDDLLKQNVEVEDPDDVLKKQKQEKEKRQQQKPNEPGEPKKQGKQDKPDNPGEQKGKNNDETINEPKNNPGDKPDAPDNKQKNKPNTSNNPDEQGEPGGNKHNQDYVDAWNEIIDRFDDDSVSEAELQQLLLDIKSGKIDSI